MNITVCGGIGAFHSNEPSSRNRTPYLQIGLDAIRAMADSPPAVPKEQGRWIIPSTLPSRCFKTQAERGRFAYLWQDVDVPAAPLEELRDAIDLRVLRCRNFEAYTSRSATPDKQKFRLLVPLAAPIDPDLWLRAQSLLWLLLRAVGIDADRAALRHGQLCYLPNRGAFYQSLPRRDGEFLDPAEFWREDLALAAAAEHLMKAAEDARKRAVEARRAAQTHTVGGSVIERFNNAYSVEDVLAEAGYDQRNSDWRHPNSESGNFSCRVFDGRAFSLSPADPLWTDGKHAHDPFGAFAAINHGGDAKAACRAAAQRLGDTWDGLLGGAA